MVYMQAAGYADLAETEVSALLAVELVLIPYGSRSESVEIPCGRGILLTFRGGALTMCLLRDYEKRLMIHLSFFLVDHPYVTGEIP